MTACIAELATTQRRRVTQASLTLVCTLRITGISELEATLGCRTGPHRSLVGIIEQGADLVLRAASIGQTAFLDRDTELELVGSGRCSFAGELQGTRAALAILARRDTDLFVRVTQVATAIRVGLAVLAIFRFVRVRFLTGQDVILVGACFVDADLIALTIEVAGADLEGTHVEVEGRARRGLEGALQAEQATRAVGIFGAGLGAQAVRQHTGA